MRISFGVLSVGLLAASASAQDTGSSGWEGTLSLEASPTYKRAEAEDTVADSVEVGDFTLATVIQSPPIVSDQRLSFTLGSTYSPIRFDGSDRESSWFAEAKVGDTYLEESVFLGDFRAAKSYEDGIRASASIRHTQKYSGLFDDGQGDAQTAKGAIEFRNILTHFCAVEAASAAPQSSSACPSGVEPSSSFGFAVGGSVSRTWSDTPTDENTTYGASGKLLFPPLRSTLTPAVAANVDRIRYDEPATAGLADRRDWKYKLTGELDFAPLLTNHDWFALKLGASQTWLNSNDPAKDADEFRGYVTLSIAWTYLGG